MHGFVHETAQESKQLICRFAKSERPEISEKQAYLSGDPQVKFKNWSKAYSPRCHTSKV